MWQSPPHTGGWSVANSLTRCHAVERGAAPSRSSGPTAEGLDSSGCSGPTANEQVADPVERAAGATGRPRARASLTWPVPVAPTGPSCPVHSDSMCTALDAQVRQAWLVGH